MYLTLTTMDQSITKRKSIMNSIKRIHKNHAAILTLSRMKVLSSAVLFRTYALLIIYQKHFKSRRHPSSLITA